MQQEFVIQYVPIKNCLLHVSNKWYKSFSSSNRLVIQLQYKNNVFYFSCICNSCNIDDSNIGINAVYANSLGIDNNSTVVLSVIQKVAIIDKLSITPASLDDWEIIELNTELIQSTLLNSIRIVALNQNIVIWVGPSLYLTARVDEMNPNNHFGYLENFTEIEIKQPKYQNKLCNTKIVEESIYAPVEQFSDNKQLVKLEKYLYHNQNIVLRVHPIHAVNIELIYLNHRTLLNNPFTCFVRSKHFPWKENDDIIQCKILCSHVQELSRNDVEIKNPNELFIQLCIIDRIFSNVPSEILESTFPCFLHGNIYLTEYLYKLLSLEDGNHIIINPNILKPTKITEIQLISCSECEDFKNQFILFINQFKTDGILLNSNTVINLSDTESCIVKLIPENVDYYHLNTENIKHIKISTVLNETETKVTLTDIDKIKKTKKIIDLDKLYLSYGNLSQIIEDCINHLKICLYSNTNLCGGHNILIKGQQGSGKSTLSKIICEKLSHFPFYLNTRIVDCKSLKGKKVETVQKSIIQIFDECVLYQPSIVIFDDLDTICGSSVESGDGIQNSETAYFNRMSEMIMTLLLEYQNDNLLSIIATIESTSNFNKILYSSRGKHIFLTDLKTPVLENNDREILLKHILNQTADASNITFEKKEKKTDGYVIQDIVDLGVKCSFEAFKRTDVLYREEKPVLENIDYENALLKFKALSLQGVNLYKSVGRKWDQIGGLKEAKEVLIETVFWPLLHSDILSQCPIRLQSGILLYGPPGTGKTILAGAAAEEFNIRLISVKGPELLSKYIGASEEAVRNIFEKAQSAKPCILFFDEFDSLAPRRGHDNTGVTDRVVNQLLTQLDGVESLIGVYVIAATSRPDLLDPALIRPGRLGRQVYCPIPNQEDRLSILSLLSSDLEFCEDVDLSCIANVTEGFSGADLQSVLYSSQMLAIDEIMNVGDEETLEDFTKGQFPTKALISQKHILDALANTQPSLSDKEKLKYKKIYDKFHGKIDGDTKEFVSQRVTLA